MICVGIGIGITFGSNVGNFEPVEGYILGAGGSFFIATQDDEPIEVEEED